MANKAIVGDWDTKAIGIDVFGPVDEVPTDTSAFPIAAGAWAAKIDNPAYQTIGSSPWAVLDNQRIVSPIVHRAVETGQYLNECINAAQNDISQGVQNTCDWRQINKSLTSLHHHTASVVSDYYRSTFTMWRMKDMELNNWQTELNDYLHRPHVGCIKQREIGMLSTLYRAYENDQEVDRCVSNWGFISDDPSPHYGFNSAAVTMVGGCMPLGQSTGNGKEYSIFVITEQSVLVELVLMRSTVNAFFLAHLKKEPRFRITAQKLRQYTHVNGRKWLKSFSPIVEPLGM